MDHSINYCDSTVGLYNIDLPLMPDILNKQALKQTNENE